MVIKTFNSNISIPQKAQVPPKPINVESLGNHTSLRISNHLLPTFVKKKHKSQYKHVLHRPLHMSCMRLPNQYSPCTLQPCGNARLRSAELSEQDEEAKTE